MRTALLFPPLLALTACAVGPSLEQRLATYVGKTELQLVSTLGVPTNTYEVGGVKFLQYGERRVIALPDSYPGPPFGPLGPLGPGYYGGFGYTSYVPVRCDVTFAVRNGRVEGFSYRGDGCT